MIGHKISPKSLPKSIIPILLEKVIVIQEISRIGAAKNKTVCLVPNLRIGKVVSTDPHIAPRGLRPP